MTTGTMVALVPRDGFFCKDGRGWHTSASGRGHALQWPWPSTVLGAVRSAWGRAEEARTGTRLQPEEWRKRTAAVSIQRTIGLRRTRERVSWSAADRVWPAPLDGVALESQSHLHRLEPEPPRLPTIGRDDDHAREALWTPVLDVPGKQLQTCAWWSEQRFVAWLAGEPVGVREPEHEFDLPRRVQAHVGIRADTFTAKDGVLFSHEVVETLQRDADWAIGLDVMLPSGELPALGTLGSDSRLVHLEPLPADAFSPPDRLLRAFSGGSVGLRLLVVSPVLFASGWLPDQFGNRGGEYRGVLPGLDVEFVLHAAIVPRPLAVSGWDMAARRPKPVARMVQPGAVYFFERSDGLPFDEGDARRLWLAAWGARTDEGFGRVVPGVWTPATRRN